MLEREARSFPPLETHPTGKDWLRAWEREHGRPLRVLHIGNIANNAYNNAKIQRQFGIAADVACHDYYHIMGCPEWEDADFQGDVGDPFFPDWRRVDLRGFRRPRWFAQGRTVTTQRYLRAWSRDRAWASWVQWRLLGFDQWLRCRSTRTASFAGKLLGIRLALRGFGTRRWLVYHASELRWRARFFLYLAGKKTVATVRALFHIARGGSLRSAALIVFPTRLGRRLGVAPELAARPSGAELEAAEQRHPEVAGDPSPVQRLAERFARVFPDRPVRFTPDELSSYLSVIPGWSSVLANYDIVQGYSTDPIIPLLCGVGPFAAYEHGTLREIPFEGTARGEMCALCYREAPVVFVTNSDVLPAAERLGLTGEQIVCLPHAVDSDKLIGFAAAHRSLAPAAGTPPVLFSPTRHDWVIDDPNLNKGNDRLLEAFAQAVGSGHDLRLVLVAWGRDVEATDSLIQELGVSERVSWVEPMDKRQLWARYLGSHAVVDQFIAPAIGGVTFEALALGRRVVTALDIPLAERFFGAAPPLLVAQQVDEIAAALARIARDPDDHERLGAASQAWFAAYHSAARIVELQVEAYARIIGRAGWSPAAD